MSRHSDPRVGHDDSFRTDQDLSSNSVTTLGNLRDDRSFKITSITVEYPESATNNGKFTIYDEPDSTSSGDLSDDRKVVDVIQPGEVRSYTDLRMRAIEDDILIEDDGNGDATAAIYVDGYYLAAVTG